MTIHQETDNLLWQLDLDSPIIAIYLLESRGLLNVPFTNIAESTMDQIINEVNKKKDSKFGIDFKTSELKLL